MESETNAPSEKKTEREQKNQNRNTTPLKKRLRKSASNAELARATMWSIKCGFLPPICNIDLYTFKQHFFSEKHTPEYARLKQLSKLLTCQYTLHNQADKSAQSIPFTYRLPTSLHGCNDSEINKKIQRKLAAVLDTTPLYWITGEKDSGLNETITHVHGEITLRHDELKKCKQAFVDLFRYYGSKPALNKPIQAAGSTITKKPMAANIIIVFSTHRRDKETALYGKFYGVFNWPSYCTKQEFDRVREQNKDMMCRKPLPDNEKFCHISKELNRKASEFYKKHIKNK